MLGHVQSVEGISANPKKVEKVWDWPIPTNAKEVHSLLGLASYFQRFILKFAHMACCLHELVDTISNKTKKIRGQKKEGKTVAQQESTNEKSFNRTSEHQQAYSVLREALVIAPVLGYPDFNREFMLETNVSLQGLGPCCPSKMNLANSM